MSEITPQLVRAGDSGFEYLTVEGDDAIDVVARLRETQADVRGRAFLLKLDHIVETLGERWEAKAPFVWEHLKTSFDQRFQEPDWCVRINDNAWMAVMISTGPRMGALKSAEIWYETGQFFVGDMSQLRLPLHEVIVDGVDRLKLRLIELNKYFDRGEDYGSKNEVRVQPGAFGEPAGPRPSLQVGTMTALGTRENLQVGTMTVRESQENRAVGTMTARESHENNAVGTMKPIVRTGVQTPVLNVGGRNLRVACSVEPVFELKKLSMIGHRLEPMVIDAGVSVQLDTRALNAMNWNDREQVDTANIEQGVKLLRTRSPDQRKILMVVPVAFSTLASTRGRSKVTTEVSRAASEMGMKVLFEIRGMSGVPPHRILEIISLVKPYCMTVVGHVGTDQRAIAALRQCGLSGVCVEFDGANRDEETLREYLTGLSVAAKASAGACMIQGFGNFRQMVVARLAGISHASVKTSALVATGART